MQTSKRDLYILAQTHGLYGSVSGQRSNSSGDYDGQSCIFQAAYNSGRGYNECSHLVGHIFGARDHSQIFWNQWWWIFGNWYTDVMTDGSRRVVNYNLHASPSNKGRILSSYIKKANSFSEPR